MSALFARFVASRLFWPIVMLLVLFAINVLAFPGFFSITIRDGNLYGSLVDILRNGAPTLIIAVGMTLVIATRGIDLSVGAVCAIAGAVACSILLGAPDPTNPGTVAIAITTAIVVGLVCGLWNGFLVAVLGIQPIIATLILMTAGRGVAMLITEGQILTVTSPPFKVLGSGFWLGVPVAVYIGAAVFVLAVLLTRRTALGMLIESVGINPEASRQAGVRSRGLLFAVYVFCALCAAIAGLILTANTMAADANATGLFIELDAILAVVIGGTSLAGGRYSLAGTLVGALVIQTLVTTVYTVGIPPIATMVFKAAVVTAVCLLQSPTTNEAFASFRRKIALRAGKGVASSMTTATTTTPSALTRIGGGLRNTFTSPKYGPVLVTLILFLAVFIGGGIRYRGFLSGQVFLNLLVDNAYLIVLAVGMTFVILTGGIDLSVGAVVALSGMIASSLLRAGTPATVVIPLILVLTSTLGLLVGLMIHYFKVQPFIATLAAMFLARGLCYVISKDSIPISDPAFVAMAVGRIPLGGGLSMTWSVVIALVVVVIAVWVLHRTRFGRTVYAIGGSEQSGVLMGLPVPRTKVLVYVVSGLCSGIAGVLFTFYTLSGYPLTAIGTELDAIAAVVIGGTLLTGGYGFVLGSVLGVLVLGIIQTIITFEGTLSSWWTKIFIGVLLLVFIVLQRVLTARRR